MFPRSLTAVMAVLALSATQAMAQGTDTASSPCLEQLNSQKAEAGKAETAPAKKPGWFSRNADKIIGGVGVLAGAALGDKLCKDTDHKNCRATGAVIGGVLGAKLGKMLSEADQKRYQEASYKVALTGRPQSLNLEKGCMVVEPASEETFEERQVEVALGAGVVAPQKLRSVAKPYVHPTAAKLAPGPSSGKGTVQVAANTPSFVMGSTDSGKYFLLGREDNDQGYVGAGYVDAKGWTASPDATPGTLAAATGQPTLVKLGVEVPCRQISSSIRVEASNKTETLTGKICRMPNGVPESTAL